MKIVILSALTAIGLTLASGANAAVNFVSDGDFSSPSGGSTFTTYGSGSPFGPWSVTSGSVDLIGGYWQAPAGTSGSLDLDGNSPGGISQSLNLTPGNYVLQFYLSGNPDGPPTTNSVAVALSSNPDPSFSYTTGSNSKTDMDYTFEQEFFTATGPTTLSFVSNDVSGAYGPVIGDVIVSSVPEPATWIMLILGFGTVGWTLRSNRQKQTVAVAV